MLLSWASVMEEANLSLLDFVDNLGLTCLA